MSNHRRQAATVHVAAMCRAPELDEAAAEALAVVTLLTTCDARDIERAGRIIEEVVAAPGGAQRLVNGLSSVCATLLVLLEFYGALALDDALHEVGRFIAQASVPT